MLKLVKRLVVSGLAVICSTLVVGCTSVSPEVLADKVALAHEHVGAAEFEFRNVQSLIGETDEAAIAANNQTLSASVLMTKDEIGFVAFNGVETTPFRMFHFSGQMASEYYRGDSTEYQSETPDGVHDTKFFFLAHEDCFLAPCFISRFGRPGLRDVEGIRNGTRDFAEEARLFICEEKRRYVVRQVREMEGENPPVDNWKVVDVFYIDRESNLIVMKATSQIEADGKGILRERHFDFIQVNKEVPASFRARLAEIKDTIGAFTVSYIAPETLDAQKAEAIAQANREYEIAEAKRREGEKQAVKEDAPQPVQQGG